MTTVEKMARAIEEAARKSVPWPSRMISTSGWDVDDDEVPQTLEHFVNSTYIGEHGADEVFRAAALASARAALTALLEPSAGMVHAGILTVHVDEEDDEYGLLLTTQQAEAVIRAAIQHALDEKDLGDE